MKEREGGGRKRCGLSLLFLVSAFILELLPYGTVLPFAVTLRRAFSYFGLTPFGYADFPPFLTALLVAWVPLLPSGRKKTALGDSFPESGENKAV